MNRVLKTLAALAGLGAVAGASVVGFGLYNVSARDGHWPGVSWVLHTTFRNSVDLRAPKPKDVPELTEAMAALGARHYDSACRGCHAAPGEEKTATVRSMVPEPPHIAEAVGKWTPAELHWIVAEGVKMSGMPHWPARDRDDDVWPVVAFLTRVEEMQADTYRAITETAPAADPRAEAEAYCAGCHGEGGASDNRRIPRLDILSQDYVALSLRTYRDGARQSGIMNHAISRFPEEQIAAFAETFSGNAEVPPAGGDPDLVAAGRALALAETGDRDVPACNACHGPARAEARAPGPRLDGQHTAYLSGQLHAWRKGQRGGGKRAELMTRAAAELSDAEIEALAAFYAEGGMGPRAGLTVDLTQPVAPAEDGAATDPDAAQPEAGEAAPEGPLPPAGPDGGAPAPGAEADGAAQETRSPAGAASEPDAAPGAERATGTE